MEFLGISFWELLLIGVVVLVVLGPSRLPGIMRTIGAIVRNIRKVGSELTETITREIDADNAKKQPSPPDPAEGRSHKPPAQNQRDDPSTNHEQ